MTTTLAFAALLGEVEQPVIRKTPAIPASFKNALRFILSMIDPVSYCF
jgi:hypothetical protein